MTVNPSDSGLGRIIRAAGYSCRGLRHVFASQAAFRQECLLAAVLLPVAFFSHVSKAERALLISSLLLILLVEILNTAFEATIDRISHDHHPLSKTVKDMGSAAVFMALLNAAIVWLVILI